MRLKYMFAKKRKNAADPFHAKSTWQPPVQNPVVLENYLEETKLEIASAIFRPQIDNISANERNVISALPNRCLNKVYESSASTFAMDNQLKGLK